VRTPVAVHLLPWEKVVIILGRERAPLEQHPSPRGEGGSQPAPSPAGARRGPHVLLVVGVRGHFLAFAAAVPIAPITALAAEPRDSLSYRQEIDAGEARFLPARRKFRQILLDRISCLCASLKRSRDAAAGGSLIAGRATGGGIRRKGSSPLCYRNKMS